MIKEETRKKIKEAKTFIYRCYCGYFIVAMIVVYFCFSTADLFQRSGSIVVLIGLLIQIHAVKAINYGMNGVNGFLDDEHIVERVCKKHFKNISRITPVVTIFGTVIWGYGDLLFELLSNQI